jgi:ribosome modulation factor
MSNCEACEQRNKVLNIQVEGREAARSGKLLKDNPYTETIQRQYWEYGWIEENFISEIDEHRAVMDYVGVHIFQLCQDIEKMEKEGNLSGEKIIASLSTVTTKLAEKLRGN